MPSVSAKQHRLMAAVASNPAVAKKTKIPQSVGKEFMEADKGKKFQGGGMADEAYKLYDNKERAFVNQKEYKSESSANKVAERRNQDFGAHRYSAEKYSDVVRRNTPSSGGGGGMGGMGGQRNSMGMIDPSAVTSQIPKHKKGGSVSSRGDGIAQRGKTKGRMV